MFESRVDFYVTGPLIGSVSSMIRTLYPELINRAVEVFIRKRDVFEAALERVVEANIGPVDAHGRIDRSFDIFWLDVAAARPAVIGGVGAGRVGRAERPSAAHSGAGEDDRLLRVMVAPAG